MMNQDEILKEMFKSINIEIEPPVGTKQRIYQRLFYDSRQRSYCYLSCILKKVLKLVIQVWILICIFMSIFTPISAL
ncbi:hypothetical protein K9O30_20635 [Clostridium bowmanii]|uniref:hypothetical protein n=1 Tax=Clostridium bowmanii TaxID=132925 RepID=UPI001C0C95FB|nr:hypothetical protein [Clostridium bowmanii]MBU3191822.1 hypothetical protein [Clostridium bowmanii]MCA1076084.1 hypothetical protein [Clostridium bowmanii]